MADDSVKENGVRTKCEPSENTGLASIIAGGGAASVDPSVCVFRCRFSASSAKMSEGAEDSREATTGRLGCRGRRRGRLRGRRRRRVVKLRGTSSSVRRREGGGREFSGGRRAERCAGRRHGLDICRSNDSRSR